MGVQYFNVTLSQCDYQKVIPTGMVRLIASDLVFFFNLADFKHGEVFLKKLEQGDELVICAERLNDGSYWINWVFHQTKGRLEPDREVGFHRGMLKSLLWALGLSSFSILAYFCFAYDEESFWLILLGSLACLAVFSGVVMGALVIKEICYIISPRRKWILKALDKVIAGQYQITPEKTPQINILGTRNPKIKPMKVKAVREPKMSQEDELNLTRGKVNLVESFQSAIMRYRGPQEICNITIIQIDRKQFTVITPVNEPVFNNHSLFMAQGDDIEVYHKKLRQAENEEIVFGIFNRQDQLAYSISRGGWPPERSFYYLLWIFIVGMIAFFTLMVLSMNIADILERGGYWDRWDWQYMMDNAIEFIGMASSISLGIGFLSALCITIYFSVSQRGRIHFQTQYYLRYLRLKRGKSGYVTEVRV
ncbi:hypothetical protein [Providencia vermicola]|uniref:hypothetical protein n=1 Tax=Providencia vermicola TaxID=333965 RepID=UPI0034D4914D